MSHPVPESRPGLRRAAWAMVITMTVLLVLALFAVVWGFVVNGRALVAKRSQAAPVAMTPAAAAGPLLSLTLAPGARIVSAQAEGGKLVLHVQGPSGDEVQVIDMATGAKGLQVRTQSPR
jgi:hypothetical protein